MGCSCSSSNWPSCSPPWADSAGVYTRSCAPTASCSRATASPASLPAATSSCPNPTGVALVPTIDCGDRTAVVEVTKDQHGPAVLASVEAKLVAAFGVPENVPDGVELRTDHGPQYTGADCEVRCDRWKLHHTFAPVERPPATPSSSASSARSRRSSSGLATGTAPTSSALPSPPGCTTTSTTGCIRPSTGRRPSSVAPSASPRPLRDPELACTHYPIPVHEVS